MQEDEEKRETRINDESKKGTEREDILRAEETDNSRQDKTIITTEEEIEKNTEVVEKDKTVTRREEEDRYTTGVDDTTITQERRAKEMRKIT